MLLRGRILDRKSNLNRISLVERRSRRKQLQQNLVSKRGSFFVYVQKTQGCVTIEHRLKLTISLFSSFFCLSVLYCFTSTALDSNSRFCIRIAYIRFFTAVHIYDFHIFPVIIHHLEGLFGSNVMTSSQLACQLNWQSGAPVSQRSWVQIPYRPEFFSGLISTTRSVVFIAARIVYIRNRKPVSFNITTRQAPFSLKRLSKLIPNFLPCN